MTSAVRMNLKFDPRLRALIDAEARRRKVSVVHVIESILAAAYGMTPRPSGHWQPRKPISDFARRFPYSLVNTTIARDLHWVLYRQHRVRKMTIGALIAKHVAEHFGRPDLAPIPRMPLGPRRQTPSTESTSSASKTRSAKRWATKRRTGT